MEYAFTLKFRLGPDDGDHDVVVESLGQSGCTDALVGIGHSGRLGLEFVRKSKTAVSAIVSAIEDVRRAIPDARLVEVGPDLAGLTDIADMIGVSRQNMRKLMLAHGGNFPSPVHEGSAALWHLAHVLEWLIARGTYRIEKSALDIAHTAMQLNQTREAVQVPIHIQQRFRALVT